MRGELKTLAIVCAATALAGCALFGPTQKKATGSISANDVRIGFVGSFSGTSAEYGGKALNGAQMAVDAVNEAGGVLGGRKLRLENKDDKSEDDTAPKVAAELADAGVVALIGTNASSSTRKVITAVAKPKGVALISPSATSPALTDPAQVDGGGWFFRTVPNDALQGKVMAALVKEGGHKKLAVVYVDGTYGQGFANRLKQEHEAGGGTATIVPYEETSEPKATYDDVIGKALDAAPDAVVLIGYPGEASVMINDWQLSGKAKGVAWYFGDGLQAQSFVDNVKTKSAVEGRRGTAPYTDPAFTAAFQKRFQKDPLFDAAAAHDAVMLVALAIEAAKTDERSAVRAALKGVSTGGERFKPDAIKAALEAARAGKDVDYDGYAGPVDLDDRGDLTSGSYVVWQVKNGKIADTGEVRRP